MLDRDGSRMGIGLMSERSSSSFALWDGTLEMQGFPLRSQPDDYTCGPTCCSMVLGYYGKSAGIGPLTTACGTYWWQLPNGNRFGMTHPDKIASALATYGINGSRVKAGVGDLRYYVRMRQPPILLVRSGTTTMHYIAVIGCSGDDSMFKIADPSNGKARWIDKDKLAAAWRFDADLSGNAVGGRKCVSCKGDGKVWTKCGGCGGDGKINGPWGSWTKCTACSGQGKWSGKCLLCGGDGRETDYMRKALETFGIKGGTMIYPRRRGGITDPVPGEPKAAINYTIWNNAKRSVKYRLPGGKDFELASGKTGSYNSTGNVNSLKIHVYATGKNYNLTSGKHKFWWMAKEGRVGLDLNYDND